MPDERPVFAAVISHKYGNNLYLARTKDELNAQIAGYCRESWGDNGTEGDAPENDKECIDEYFDPEGRESLEYHDNLTI